MKGEANISRRAKITLLVTLGVTTVLALVRVKGVLTPFFLAGIIGYIGHPVVRYFESRGMSRTTAIILMYAAVLFVFVFVTVAALPPLAKELEQIAVELPEKRDLLERSVRDVSETLRRARLSDMTGRLIEAAFRRVEIIIGLLAERLTDVIVAFFGSIFNSVLALFLAFYVLRDMDMLRSVVVSWLPKSWREHAFELAQRIDYVVGGFIRSQLIVSVIIGSSVAGGLMLLGVKYALFLGLLTGLADIIPYFGPVVSAIPAIALALLQSPVKALWVLILLIVVQQLEGSVIGPKIVGDQVGLHPLSVIFVVLAGGEVAGIFGMLVAVPAAAAIKVIFTYIGEKSLD